MTPPLCRVYTDEGIYGDGEVALSYGGASRAAFGMLQDLARHLIGMNPLELKLFGRHYIKNVSGTGMADRLFLEESVLLILHYGIKREKDMAHQSMSF